MSFLHFPCVHMLENRTSPHFFILFLEKSILHFVNNIKVISLEVEKEDLYPPTLVRVEYHFSPKIPSLRLDYTALSLLQILELVKKKGSIVLPVCWSGSATTLSTRK